MKRHPAEVTADRLEQAHVKYYDLLTPAELDHIWFLMVAFREIASGERRRQDR